VRAVELPATSAGDIAKGRDMETMNPFQVPRLEEIRAGRKFWGYLDTEAFRSRYVLAAHFVRGARHVVEVGGYRGNVITSFLTGKHESVSVYSLDAEFDPLERDTLNGGGCRVRHVRDFFQNHEQPADGVGVVALGLEVHGDLRPFCDLVDRAETTVIEIPVDHRPSVECLDAVRAQTRTRVRCQVDLDLSANEAILRDELLLTSMNPPYWRRHIYVLERAS
jgi:hypothetical protein